MGETTGIAWTDATQLARLIDRLATSQDLNPPMSAAAIRHVIGDSATQPDGAAQGELFPEVRHG